MIKNTKEAVSKLQRINEFTEFRSSNESSSEYDDNSPYSMFGEFALLLENQIKQFSLCKSESDQEFLQDGFHLIDEMITSPNLDVVNLIYVGVLEVLASIPNITEVGKKYLNVASQQIFEEYIEEINRGEIVRE